jgi:hypothetical protein
MFEVTPSTHFATAASYLLLSTGVNTLVLENTREGGRRALVPGYVLMFVVCCLCYTICIYFF